jgi:RNA polymerase sigma factor for flagellar operon FliA
LDYDDLLGQAVVGLIDAVDRFDPARGIKFETYAYYRIRGTVMDMLRALDWLPRSVRQREGKMAEAFAKLEGQFGRPPSDEEVARELGLTVEQLNTLAHEVALQAVQSLDESCALQSSEGTTLGDVVADATASSPEAEAERQTEREMLASAVDALPGSERTVISLYYYDGLTLKEIGRVLGVTESRACQIHAKAIIRLRAHVQSLLSLPESASTVAPNGKHRRHSEGLVSGAASA